MLYLIKANLMIRNRLQKCSVAEMISLRSKVSNQTNVPGANRRLEVMGHLCCCDL